MYPDYYNMYNELYGFDNYNKNYNYRNSPSLNNNIQTDNSGEIITLNQALELIKKSVGDERKDEMFYNRIIEQAPTEKEKDILKSIRDDEKKHNRILRNVYFTITGQMIPENQNTSDVNESKNKMSYKENLEYALFGELEAVSKYRKIMGAMPDNDTYTLIMSIMTDELKHANKYNFLIHNAK